LHQRSNHSIEAARAINDNDNTEQAMAYFSNHSGATIYYYSKYERTIYRKLQAKYSDVCSADDIECMFEPTRAVLGRCSSGTGLGFREWPESFLAGTRSPQLFPYGLPLA